MEINLVSTILRDIEQVSESAYREIPVTVFLCGKALQEGKTAEEQVDTDLRAFLKQRLEHEIPSCNVALAECTQILRAFNKATGGKNKDLMNFELELAHLVDVIVLFPCSPGSFAELGMFSYVRSFTQRMTIVVDKEYKNHNSFINLGPIKAAKDLRAKVEYIDYTDREGIFELVRAEVDTQKSYKRRKAFED